MSHRNGFVVSLACIGLLAAAPGASADPITLYTAGYSNLVSANSNDGYSAGSTTYDYVTALPATVSATGTSGTSTSTSTGDLSTSTFNFGFNQSVVDPNSYAHGDDQFSFTAGVDTTYTISGSLTATGGFTSEQLYLDLQDETANTEPYFYHTGSTAATQAFDSSGGALTGLLTAGDVYYLRVSDSLYGDNAALTGNTLITFTQPSSVPEPSSWIMLGLGSSLPFYIRTRRRRSPA